MAGKWKKRLKKIGKVAAIAGAAALAAKLGTKRSDVSGCVIDGRKDGPRRNTIPGQTFRSPAK